MSNVTIKEQKIFKQLTGGDSIQAENKGENSFTFQYRGLMWFLANHLPLFGGDKGKHVYERWIVIHCTHAIPEEDQIKDLQDRMFEERDSFCIKALNAFRKAVEDNYQFAIPQSCVLANEEYQRKNSSVRSFVDECCEPTDWNDLQKEMTTGQIWNYFCSWCRENGNYTPSKSEFKRELAEILGVAEDDLVKHTSDGNFYPIIANMTALRAEVPWI